jgi:hypothetical protein
MAVQKHTVLIDGQEVLSYVGADKAQAFAEMKKHKRAMCKQIISVAVY